jgi:drug/metabolite transporter (DMT)-like permease
MRLIIFIGIVVLTGTAGDICLSHAMKRIGGEFTFSFNTIVPMIGRAFRSAWMWIAIALMAVAFFSLLALLSWADASLVIPATALSYVAGAVGAKFFLGEKVSPIRWAGALLVCAGVALLSFS